MFRNSILLTLLLALPVMAEDPTSQPAAETQHECVGCAAKELDFVSLEFGGQLTTAYYARGILQENQGVIGQPWAEIQLHLFQKDFVSDIYVFARTWNSFHSGPSGSESNFSSSPASWYESSFSAGLGVKLCNALTVSGGYTINFSPNDRFDTIEELFLRGDLDDRFLWKGFDNEYIQFDGIRPYGLFAWESDGQRDAGRNRGVYAEVGINPGITLTPDPEFTARISAPITVGLNIFEYYETPNKGDAPYGFTNVGLRGELPLGWIPSKYGEWTLFVQGTWYHLDQNLSKLNSEDNTGLIASGGLTFNY